MRLRKIDGLKKLRDILQDKIFGNGDNEIFLESFKTHGPGRLLPLCGTAVTKSEEEKIRQFLADFFASEILEIADNDNKDPDMPDHKDQLARDKLRIETRRWLMEQFAPERYSANRQGKGEKTLKSLFRTKVYLPDNDRH